MAAKLSRSASGARHLGWAIQIHATAQAHTVHNYLLTPEQKAALVAEIGTLEGLIAKLESAVTEYGAFNRGAYTESRAKQAVADFLCDAAQSAAEAALRGLPEIEDRPRIS
ncbi:MAG: hypothetical protein H5U40_10360, partial [Polyangiaceae bacterium]|nr:hypothetical protein [Polyangiaceae bacterium]